MSLLDTKTITPEVETPEVTQAADSRFFVDQNWRFDDLHELQDAIGNMAFVMRASGDEERNRAELQQMDFLMGLLGDRMKQHEGHVVIAMRRSAMTRYESYQDIARDYEVPYDGDGTSVLFVPVDKISAIQPNPQFYGSGHDVQPVVNFGIETYQGTTSSGDAIYVRRWLQVPVEAAPIGLFSETA